MKSWANAKRTVLIVFKPLLAKPIWDLDGADIPRAADVYPRQPSARSAMRSLRPIIKWATRKADVAARKYAPKALLEVSAGTANERDRFLDDAELARLLPVLLNSKRTYAGAMLLMPGSATRHEEVGKATWEQFDLDETIWTLPAKLPPAHKNRAGRRIKANKTGRVAAVGIVVSGSAGGCAPTNPPPTPTADICNNAGSGQRFHPINDQLPQPAIAA